MYQSNYIKEKVVSTILLVFLLSCSREKKSIKFDLATFYSKDRNLFLQEFKNYSAYRRNKGVAFSYSINGKIRSLSSVDYNEQDRDGFELNLDADFLETAQLLNIKPNNYKYINYYVFMKFNFLDGIGIREVVQTSNNSNKIIRLSTFDVDSPIHILYSPKKLSKENVIYKPLNEKDSTWYYYK